MRYRLVKQGLSFAGLHFLTVASVFALASPLMNDDGEPSSLALAAAQVLLVLIQPGLALMSMISIDELTMILANSLLWGTGWTLILQVAAWRWEKIG